MRASIIGFPVSLVLCYLCSDGQCFHISHLKVFVKFGPPVAGETQLSLKFWSLTRNFFSGMIETIDRALKLHSLPHAWFTGKIMLQKSWAMYASARLSTRHLQEALGKRHCPSWTQNQMFRCVWSDLALLWHLCFKLVTRNTWEKHHPLENTHYQWWLPILIVRPKSVIKQWPWGKWHCSVCTFPAVQAKWSSPTIWISWKIHSYCFRPVSNRGPFAC